MFTFTASPQQLHVFDTAPNWRGLCSLSPSSANSLLAFPSQECDNPNVIAPGDDNSSVDSEKSHGSKISSSQTSTTGNVKLIDLADTDKRPIIIPAHSSKYEFIFNSSNLFYSQLNFSDHNYLNHDSLFYF